MARNKTDDKSLQLVKVRLIQPHNHRRVNRKVGDIIELPRFRAERLVNPDNEGRPAEQCVRPSAEYVKE